MQIFSFQEGVRIKKRKAEPQHQQSGFPVNFNPNNWVLCPNPFLQPHPPQQLNFPSYAQPPDIDSNDEFSPRFIEEPQYRNNWVLCPYPIFLSDLLKFLQPNQPPIPSPYPIQGEPSQQQQDYSQLELDEAYSGYDDSSVGDPDDNEVFDPRMQVEEEKREKRSRDNYFRVDLPINT